MTRRPTDLLERVSRCVENHPAVDAGAVRLGVSALRGSTDEALRRLERAGFVERRDGRYWSFKAYHENPWGES